MNRPGESTPQIGVVVVHFNGGQLTLECIRSVLESRWPANRLRIVLVDNASTDGIADLVRAEFPSVEVVSSPTNLGFAGGCNLGLQQLTDVDYVALVNNDAIVEPGWLEPLVEALASDASLGAACPRILFSEQFRDVHLSSTTTRRGRGDRRDLGVRISGAHIDGHDVWRKVQFVSGAWEHEHDGADEHMFRWLGRDAMLRLPDRPGRASLRLASDDVAEVTVRSGAAHATLTVTNSPQWFEVEVSAPAVDIVNNAGSELVYGAVGADRGLYHPDGAEYLDPAEVFAWCGAGVLMRARYLQDVGVFDERLFLYSEDFELAWRGREHGWRYAYVPQAVLRHVHMASSIDGSALKLFYDGRNQLLVALRHASATSALNTLGWYVRATASRALRDVVAPLLSGRRPTIEAVAIRTASSQALRDWRRQWSVNGSGRVDSERAPFARISAMAVLVTLFGVVLALLALLVSGLLRSHAEILRALHELGANLDPARADNSSASPVAAPTVRPTQVAARPPRTAADIAGVTPAGDAVSIAVLGTRHLTLLAFLSSGCSTCHGFWDAWRDDAPIDVPGDARLVIVTKDPSAESVSSIHRLAPRTVPVVMSTAAWEAYDVPVAPFFVLVDGANGNLVGEGAASNWEQVVSLLQNTLADAGLLDRRGRTKRGGVSKPDADARREARVDRELLAAGIVPGDPSLYVLPFDDAEDEGTPV